MTTDMIDELLADARERMHKSVEAMRSEFGSVRTGRASPALLDRIQVDYYGTGTPLKQLATINAPEARLLTIQPYDKSSIKAIERAILESDIGLTPSNDGNVIRLAIPELTEERRRQLVKVVRHICEEGRVAIRNVRRDVMHDLRELKTAGDAGEDDERRAEAELQKVTDARISELMEMFAGRIELETPELHEQGVRMRFIGRRGAPIAPQLIERMNWAEGVTGENRRITLFVAFNYGGRAEIIDAARTFTGGTEADFRARLYAPDMHDPDLIIRTSGELRLSNYLLWQGAYSELVFREELWPDFSRQAFEQTLEEFAARQRRFGGR